MIPAHLKDQAFLAEVQAMPEDPNQLHVWWLGQSGFLVKWQAAKIVFDPYLSDSLTRKYAQTDKPHVRMSERVIDPERLTGIRAVTSSHNHTDHLDADTLIPLSEANPDLQLVLPTANVEFARGRLGPPAPQLAPVDVGKTVAIGPFSFHGIHAAHNEVEHDEHGHSRYLGFVLTVGPFAVYHSGDTLWHPNLVKELSPWSIDLALLPINGNVPARRVAGNLNGTEAAALARAIGARQVVPCHYHMFGFNTEEPDEFVSVCQRLGQPATILKTGEGLTLTTLFTA